MKKVILFNMMTLDGFFEGPNKELDWHKVDKDFNEFAIQQLNDAGTLIFGRITYELMASYWPSPTGLADDPVVAKLMNTISKLVFSTTLEKAEWENTMLVKGNVERTVSELKRSSRKDIFILGSADLADTLKAHNLIDEYRIMISPVLLGKGNPLFKNTDKRLDLKLIKTVHFNSGNVLLIYQPGS